MTLIDRRFRRGFYLAATGVFLSVFFTNCNNNGFQTAPNNSAVELNSMQSNPVPSSTSPSTTLPMTSTTSSTPTTTTTSTTSTTSTLPAPQGVFPPETKNYAMTNMISMPLPAYLQPVTDTALGNKVIRITDAAAFGNYETAGPLKMLKHAYAKNQPWNADESLIFLTAKYPGVLLDGKTYQYLRKLPEFNVDMERVWSNTNPNIMYGIKSSPAALKMLNLQNDQESTVASFPEYSWLSLGSYEGNLSDQDDLACLMGQKGSDVEIVSYNLKTKTVLGRKRFANTNQTSDMNWCTASPSGNYIAIGFTSNKFYTADTVQLFDHKMNFLRQLSTNQDHVDFGYDTAGEEVMVGSNSTTGDIWHEYIYSARLRDGTVRMETPVGRFNNATHTSCRNTKRPGWCYISEFASVDPSHPISYYNFNNSLGLNYINYNETIAIKLDGSGTIRRFGKEHHNQSPNFNYDTMNGYERSPMSVPSRSGERVLFASDWEDASPGAFVHTFISWW